MNPCICLSVQRLAESPDEHRAEAIIAAINDHLADLHRVLTQSKALSRHVRYRITPSNHRTSKASQIDSIDLAEAQRLFVRFGHDGPDGPEAFWTVAANDHVHPHLRRRLATVAVYIRSRINMESVARPELVQILNGQQDAQDVRNAGRKYVKIARKLGGFGALAWLPSSMAPSTYERYLNIDDDKIFAHLRSMAPEGDPYGDLVQKLILYQIQDSSLTHFNLFADHSNLVTPFETLALVLYTLGGTDIPEVLLRCVNQTQRRWNADGEITTTDASAFGLPHALLGPVLDPDALNQSGFSAHVTRNTLTDNSPAWSLSGEMIDKISRIILPLTLERLGEIALKLICFACPPCYEGNVTWTASMKQAIWPILHRALQKYKVRPELKEHMLEAVLYFCERDSVDIRHLAIQEAKALLRSSMPYYLHASVVLFHSVLYRLGGDFVESDEAICNFRSNGPRPVTRRDHAILGRLHISQIDNRIRCYDKEVRTFIYGWAGQKPLSTLEAEVTSRLQSAAARFFQAIGDFSMARASLEDLMSLDSAKPIRTNTRRLFVGRLADVYCELGEYHKALKVLQPEMDSVTVQDRRRRLFWRLLLASVEARIGLGELDIGVKGLEELQSVMPIESNDLYDEQLHMRQLLATARIVQMRPDPSPREVVSEWQFALEKVHSMHTLKAGAGFTAAMVYLCLAYAQLANADEKGAYDSWIRGSEILETEVCEFAIPIVPTTWLHRIASEVWRLKGWTCRMMLLDGSPDSTWPAQPQEKQEDFELPR